MLTSFSSSFCSIRARLPYYIEGAKAIDTLNEQTNSHCRMLYPCTSEGRYRKSEDSANAQKRFERNWM